MTLATATTTSELTTLRTWVGRPWSDNTACPLCDCRKSGDVDVPNRVFEEGCGDLGSVDGTNLCRCHTECSTCFTEYDVVATLDEAKCPDCVRDECAHDDLDDVTVGDSTLRNQVWCNGCETQFYVTPEGLDRVDF